MAEVQDGYDAYYAQRLWQLLPAVYRTSDSDQIDVAGPLQELTNRLGVQVAVLRRSIDRLWADQSIETCDDWVIPYIGDLLDANLVNGADARGQRVDVARTIHYRRRKGTLAVLEEIARDVTGWDAHVVEGFRRLARTRHNLDPAVGPAAGGTDALTLLRHEGLVGQLTGTPAGGFADLRNVHGAALADSPFDELFHSADLRLGQGAVGRYAIPKLLVFLWRLISFTVSGVTPVAVSGCPGQYVLDPTGRSVQLFLAPLAAESDDYADAWTSAHEWQVPGPLTSSLLAALGDSGTAPPRHAPYPDSGVSSAYAVSEGEVAQLWPQLGRVAFVVPPSDQLTVSYQYGFSAMIGAGPYDRSTLADPPVTVGSETTVAGGGDALSSALTGLPTSDGALAGTITIGKSLTYSEVVDVGANATPIGQLLLRAGPDGLAVVRLAAPADAGDPPTEWVFTGGGDAQLTLDGLLISGGDIVLRGAFASVRLTGCTLDPGTLDDTGETLAVAADGRPLVPVRLWIEADPQAPPGSAGAIDQLLVDNCVLGPIRTRNAGVVRSTTINDSTVQGIVTAAAGPLAATDLLDPQLLARGLAGDDPLSQRLLGLLPAPAQQAVRGYGGGPLTAASLSALLDGLGSMLAGDSSIYSPSAFADVALDPALAAAVAAPVPVDAAALAALNRRLLTAAFPVALSPAALALTDGEVALERVTVLGDALVHRLQASDSLLVGRSLVDDTQYGCVRFSATVAGSRVPRQFRAATIAPGSALFTSAEFGNPGYAQLLETADRAIVSGAAAASLTAGAQSGSEMGAFSGLLAPLKERGLLVKYGEYMPLGLAPVIVHVT